MTAINILPDDHAELRAIIARMEGTMGGIAAAGAPGVRVHRATGHQRILAAIFQPLLHRQPVADTATGAEAPASAMLLRQGHDAILADDECWWLKVYMHHEGIAHPDAEVDESSPARAAAAPADAAFAVTGEALLAAVAQRLTVDSDAA